MTNDKVDPIKHVRLLSLMDPRLGQETLEIARFAAKFYVSSINVHMATSLQRNPEALKFNVCKKLAQLNRVIVLFKGQEADRIWKCKCLYDIYDPKIKQALIEYSEDMQKINEEVSVVGKEIIEKIETDYTAKHAKFQEDFQAMVNTLAEENQKKIDDVIVEVTSSKTLFETLKQGLVKRSTAFEQEIEELKQQLKDKLRDSKEKMKKEIETVDNETNTRLTQLKSQFDEKQKQMKEDYEKELARIRKEATDNDDTAAQQLKFIDDVKARIKSLKNEMKRLKSELKGSKTENYKFLTERKDFVASFCKDMKEEIATNEGIKQDFEEKMQKALKEWKEQEQTLKEECKAKQIENDKQFEKMNVERMKMLDEMKAELDKIRKDFEFGQEQNGVSLTTLKEDYAKEITELEKNLESARVSAQKKLEEIKKKVESRVKACQEKEELERQNNKIRKEEFEKSICELESSLQKQIEDMKVQFKTELGELDAKIGEMTGASEKTQAKKVAELDLLKHQKDEVIAKHKSELALLDEECENDVKSLREKHEKELKTFNESQNANLDEEKRKAAKEIEAKKTEHEAQKENLVQKLSDLHEKTISEIENQGYSKEEYQDMEKRFEAESKRLTKILDGINAPAADQDQFREMNQEIDSLENELQTLKQKIDESRSALIQNYNDKIDDENKRHDAATKPTHSGRGRKQVLQSITQQIEAVKSELAEEIKSLEETKHNLDETHNSRMFDIQSEKETLNDQTEIDSLKSQLANWQNELAKTDNIEESRKIEISQQEARNSELSAHYQQQIHELELQIKSIEEDFLKQKEQIDEDRASSLANIDDLYNTETRTFKETIAKMTKNHEIQKNSTIAQQKAIKQSQLDMDEEFAKELNREFARGENRVTDLERSQNEEARKRDEEWNGMLGFYTERIGVLTAQLEKAKHLLDNCPPRQCDLDTIAKLENTLRIVKTQLGNSLTDLKQYRSMLVEQERKYNKAFGVSPKVGVMQSPRECL